MNTADRNQLLTSAFRSRFGAEPTAILRAPGRVNLIGEHTDYNDGFVLPVAIDRDVRIAASRRTDRQVNLYSLNFDQLVSFDLDAIAPDTLATWSNYPRGVIKHLAEAGYRFGGIDAAIAGNVPVAAGLSSSAAIEIATATTVSDLYGLGVDPVQKAVICQRAENQFIGVNCGIMDQ